MWYFLEWQGKGKWWGEFHSVARVSPHPHRADFFTQSILWPLPVMTVTWLAHQESPWLPWLLGSCPSLGPEKTHTQLQHKVRGGVCHWSSMDWVLWGIRKNRWLLAGTETEVKRRGWKKSREQGAVQWPWGWGWPSFPRDLYQWSLSTGLRQVQPWLERSASPELCRPLPSHALLTEHTMILPFSHRGKREESTDIGYQGAVVQRKSQNTADIPGLRF